MNGISLRLGRPLLADPARRWAALLLAGCVVVVALLGLLFAHHTVADGFDHAVDSPFITSLGVHYTLVLWLAAGGSQAPAVVFSAAIVIGCLLTGRLNGAVLGVLAVPVTIGLNEEILKPLVHRTYLGALSYPSGHTASVFAIATAVTVLLLAPPRPVTTSVLRVLIPAAACLLGVIVAIGVISLKWHYFTDTIGGAAVGIGTVCLLALLLDLPVVRRTLALASPARRTEPQKEQDHAESM